MKLTLSGLLPGKNYSFQLRSNVGGEISEWSTSYNITTTFDNVAPAVPAGLTITGVESPINATKAIISASWSSVSDSDLAGYRLRYRQGTSGNFTVINTTKDQLSYTINNLEVGKPYEFSIAAFDANGNVSAFSTTVTYTQNNTAPSKPSVPVLVGDIQSFAITHDLTKDGGGSLESDVVALKVWIGNTSTWSTASPVLQQTIAISPGYLFAISQKIPIPLAAGSPAKYIYITAVDSGGLESTNSNAVAVTISGITGTYIENATISSAKISDLAANKITAGTGIINDLSIKSILTVQDGGIVQSSNYVAQTSGWIIKADGSAEFNNVDIRGDLYISGNNNTAIWATNDSGQPWIYLESGAPGVTFGGIRSYLDLTENTPYGRATVELASPKKITTSQQATLKAFAAPAAGPAFQPGFEMSHGLELSTGNLLVTAGNVTSIDHYLGGSGVDAGRGFIYFQSDVRSTVINTTETLMFAPSLSATVESGRAYMIRWRAGNVYASTTAGICQIRIRKTNTTGTVVVDHRKSILVGASNAITISGNGYFTPASSGNITFVMTGFTQASSSTADGTGSRERFIEIVDVGPSTSFNSILSI